MIALAPSALIHTQRWSRLLAGLLGLALLLMRPTPAVAAAAAQTCTPISEAQVMRLFERWDSALASGDPEQVVALYSDDALLLPTLSATPRTGPEAIHDYFVDFLARSPQGRIDSRQINLGCDRALDAGTYSFLVRDPERPEAEASWVHARYSFLYAAADGEWRIVHHHSSLQPS